MHLFSLVKNGTPWRRNWRTNTLELDRLKRLLNHSCPQSVNAFQYLLTMFPSKHSEGLWSNPVPTTERLSFSIGITERLSLISQSKFEDQSSYTIQIINPDFDGVRITEHWGLKWSRCRILMFLSPNPSYSTLDVNLFTRNSKRLVQLETLTISESIELGPFTCQVRASPTVKQQPSCQNMYQRDIPTNSRRWNQMSSWKLEFLGQIMSPLPNLFFNGLVSMYDNGLRQHSKDGRRLISTLTRQLTSWNQSCAFGMKVEIKDRWINPRVSSNLRSLIYNKNIEKNEKWLLKHRNHIGW